MRLSSKKAVSLKEEKPRSSLLSVISSILKKETIIVSNYRLATKEFSLLYVFGSLKTYMILYPNQKWKIYDSFFFLPSDFCSIEVSSRGTVAKTDLYSWISSHGPVLSGLSQRFMPKKGPVQTQALCPSGLAEGRAVASFNSRALMVLCWCRVTHQRPGTGATTMSVLALKRS